MFIHSSAVSENRLPACLPSVCSLAALLSIVQVFTTPPIRPCVVWWFSRLTLRRAPLIQRPLIACSFTTAPSLTPQANQIPPTLEIQVFSGGEKREVSFLLRQTPHSTHYKEDQKQKERKKVIRKDPPAAHASAKSKNCVEKKAKEGNDDDKCRELGSGIQLSQRISLVSFMAPKIEK